MFATTLQLVPLCYGAGFTIFFSSGDLGIFVGRLDVIGLSADTRLLCHVKRRAVT
jgi:hypothetical protein